MSHPPAAKKKPKKSRVAEERVFKEVTINNYVSKPQIESMTSKEARRLEKIHLIELAKSSVNFDTIRHHR